jgi:hypothetical protein
MTPVGGSAPTLPASNFSKRTYHPGLLPQQNVGRSEGAKRLARELSLADQDSEVAMIGMPKLCVPSRKAPPPVSYVGVFAFKNVRRCRTANGTRSFASFHGKKVICAFGASIADSSATA